MADSLPAGSRPIRALSTLAFVIGAAAVGSRPWHSTDPGSEAGRAISKDERGFTLIELVVVAVLAAVLSAILYGTITGIVRSRDLAARVLTRDRTAHYVLSRMTHEIAGRSALVPLAARKDSADGASPSAQPSPQPSLGFAGFVGGTQYILGSRGEEGESSRDSIRFVSAGTAQGFIGAFVNYGLVEIEYRLEEDPNAPPARDDRKRLLLVREERPAAVPAPEVAEQRKVVVPIAENVRSLGFRYLKDGKWLPEWKNQSPPLPEAIEITLEVVDEEGGTDRYRTAVFVNRRQRRGQNQLGQAGPQTPP